MEINLPVFSDLALTITDKPAEQKAYPTWRLQKGFRLVHNGLTLAEEAVGFGLPVLKRGLQTVFPGDLELALMRNGTTWEVSALYTLNLVEKIINRNAGVVKGRALYAAKNLLAASMRIFPSGRGLLSNLSSGLRRVFGWETTYAIAEFSAQVRMFYKFDEGTGMLATEADFAGIPPGSITEGILMNEQGAQYFDRYRDSSGVQLAGREIGCWDEVTAGEAGFTSSTRRIAFTLPRVPEARLFRGRELIGSRLAWAGFGYTFPPATGNFSYTVKLEKLA